MADSTPEPDRIAEILREIIALSQTGRRNRPEPKNGTEAAHANKSRSEDNEFEKTSDANDRQAERVD